ncbi:hypothetical protein M9H77_13934 [Catharanthus roseus]|uniref:Uncharacterized protein n=1 Tax=Catharanthus roseus TaxID=4058 RepID=A0ACC0BLN0_CATRO|nr:hypothetical protein M9H77_13934 [Catharanthus roseus]
MEEVPAHVHPGPIVPDVLSRQHKHRSGLIWNRDHEMCYTDLHYKHFGRNSATIRLPPEVLLICYEIVEYHYPGHGAGGGRPSVLPVLHRHEHFDPRHVEVEMGEGFEGVQPTVDPFDSPNLDIPSFSLGLTPASQSLPSGFGTSQTPPLPGLGFASFQAPHSTSFGFSGFRAPPSSEHSRFIYTASTYIAGIF